MGGNYIADAKCPFYHEDNGKTHRITCEGIVPDSCTALIFKRRSDYRVQIKTFCCQHYKKCEVYGMLIRKYEE